MERQNQRTFQIVQEKTPTRCEICHQDDQFDPVANLCRRCAPIDVVQLTETLAVASEPMAELELSPIPPLPGVFPELRNTGPYPFQPQLGLSAICRLYGKAIQMVLQNAGIFFTINLFSVFSALLAVIIPLLLSLALKSGTWLPVLLSCVFGGLIFLLQGGIHSTAAYVAREIHARSSLGAVQALDFVKNRQLALLSVRLGFHSATFMIFVFTGLAAAVLFDTINGSGYFIFFACYLAALPTILFQALMVLVNELVVFERAKQDSFLTSSWLTTLSKGPLFLVVLLEWLIKGGLWYASFFTIQLYSGSVYNLDEFFDELFWIVALYLLLKIPFNPVFQTFRTLLYLHLRSRADGHPLQLPFESEPQNF
ncbi:MAG: hypothetical protein K1Y36_05170 [Blastocatellia bacterium]|nr:hypothetical protein [Blastocatellia bacterium]